MLTLYDRAKADNKRILNNGFHATATITNPSKETQTIEVFYIDVPFDVDPATGLPIKGRHIACSLHHADLTIGDPAAVTGDWLAAFTNNVGGAISGVMEGIVLDRTLGTLSFSVGLLEDEE